MLELRASGSRPQSLVSIERRAHAIDGIAAAAQQVVVEPRIVRTVNVLDFGPLEPHTVSAIRSYLSGGLVSPEAPLRQLGWLVDIRA